jgi:hypothetical protein
MSAVLLAEALRALVPIAEQARVRGSGRSHWHTDAVSVLRKAAPCDNCLGSGEAGGFGAACGRCSEAGWTPASVEAAIARAEEREGAHARLEKMAETYRRMGEQPLPCGHKVEDLIGGPGTVTKCGACLAERQAAKGRAPEADELLWARLDGVTLVRAAQATEGT